MAHEADHSNVPYAGRRRTIARPAAPHTPTEIETLQRAAHHIRLRSHDMPERIVAEGSSAGGPAAPAGDADA